MSSFVMTFSAEHESFVADVHIGVIAGRLLYEADEEAYVDGVLGAEPVLVRMRPERWPNKRSG